MVKCLRLYSLIQQLNKIYENYKLIGRPIFSDDIKSVQVMLPDNTVKSISVKAKGKDIIFC